MRVTRAVVVPVLMAGTLAAASPAAGAAPAAASTGHRNAAAPFAVNGYFLGVAATSASNAWAVGSAGGKTLILRWNGTSWR